VFCLYLTADSDYFHIFH